MRSIASARTFRWMVASAAMVTFACLAAAAQEDPPDQAGRISAVSGTVSVQPAGSDDWGQAYPNLPIAPGDRLYTDQNGQAEIQLGQSYVRVGPNTDVTLVNDDANALAFGVAQGSIHVHVFGLWQGQSFDISTANGDARLAAAGELRADVMADQGLTIFSSLDSAVVVTGGGGFWQQMGAGQSLEVEGTNPVSAEWLQPAGADALDQWSQQRDQQIATANSYQYVSPEIPGSADLDAYGTWSADSDYGPVWYPSGVAADWAPYRYGHWINRDPWGWVWVEEEPWGYAPFHYGRWAMFRGRWGWVPGPREMHPVWSPALVVFAGGIEVGGVGVSAWFPLGPGEPYRPWYRCSPRYIDRVNITNIRASRAVHVETTYVNIVNVRNVTYVNRTVGASAVRQDDFAAGRPVRRVEVKVDPRQFDRVQATNAPAPVTRQSFVPRPVSHPVPVTVSHPVFINQKGMQVTARPGTQPMEPPVRPVPPMKPLPGRTVVAPPPRGGPAQRQPEQPQQPQAPPRGGPVRPAPMPPQPSPSDSSLQNRRYVPPPATAPASATPSQNVPPRTQPPAAYHQDFGPAQPDKHREEAPPPPVNSPQPPRPSPAPPAPPKPAPAPQVRQDNAPPQQQRQRNDQAKPNRDQPKDQRKEDKKKDK